MFEIDYSVSERECFYVLRLHSYISIEIAKELLFVYVHLTIKIFTLLIMKVEANDIA